MERQADRILPFGSPKLRGGHVIIVVGLAFEARIAAGPGVHVICSGDGRDLASRLTAAIASAHTHGYRGIVSFGVAGGLAPQLPTGACVVGTHVVSGSSSMSTDREWSEKLLRTIPGAVSGGLVGVSAPVAHPRDKQELFIRTGAMAVDMESHIVAAVGLEHDIPFAAIRVITDPAKRTLPASAIAAMRPNGTTDLWAMFRSVLKRPRDVPALLRTALDARAARAALVRGRYWLGPAPTIAATG
jgi:hopanoid-associated phosphorylase